MYIILAHQAKSSGVNNPEVDIFFRRIIRICAVDVGKRTGGEKGGGGGSRQSPPPLHQNWIIIYHVNIQIHT